MAADELRKEHDENEKKINASLYAPNMDLKTDAYIRPRRWQRFMKDFKLKTSMMILFAKPDVNNETFMDAVIDSELKLAAEDYSAQKNEHAIQAEKIGHAQAGDAVRMDAAYRTALKQTEEMEERLRKLREARNRKTIFGGRTYENNQKPFHQ